MLIGTYVCIVPANHNFCFLYVANFESINTLHVTSSLTLYSIKITLLSLNSLSVQQAQSAVREGKRER